MATYAEILKAVQQVRPSVEDFPIVHSSPSPPAPPSDQEELSTRLIASEPPREEGPRKISHQGTTAERAKKRKYLYDHFRRVFIVHVLAPSDSKGQDYDIFIYLKRHHDESLSDVTKAEFFFGDYWGNRIFEGQHEGDVIGVRLSAYGSFLCTCLVTFDDGEQVSLYRYIDFEMGKVMERLR